MKNVKKCSLSGVAFTMDTDAYETLSAYMDSLRASCGHTPDGDEIAADIEARIAELILSTHSADSVVEKPLVDNIIKQMGRPEDISSESEQTGASESADAGNNGGSNDDAASGAGEPRIPRRLYRDMDGAKLGGVCTGLARYFNTDPVWIRLVFVLPLLLTPMSGVVRFFGPMFGNMFCMFILAYIIMWFAVPAARSARQRLEMKGERITAQSIRDATMAGSAVDADSEAKPVVANVVTVFGQIVLILLKIFAGIIVFALIIAACAMIIGMMAVAISGSSELIHSDHSVLLSILGISTALVPTMLLIYVLMCLIASRKPGGKTVLMMFILWVMTIMGVIATALYEFNSDSPSGRIISRNITHETAVVDGDTVRAVRTVNDSEESDSPVYPASPESAQSGTTEEKAAAPADIDISFEKDSMRFAVTESL